MSNLKNIYIKAPKKTVSNKNVKMVIKQNSVKKINKKLVDNFKPIEINRSKSNPESFIR